MTTSNIVAFHAIKFICMAENLFRWNILAVISSSSSSSLKM